MAFRNRLRLRGMRKGSAFLSPEDLDLDPDIDPGEMIVDIKSGLTRVNSVLHDLQITAWDYFEVFGSTSAAEEFIKAIDDAYELLHNAEWDVDMELKGLRATGQTLKRRGRYSR